MLRAFSIVNGSHGRPNSVVVNIVRGEMIDDDAVLVEKRIVVAGLDVFDYPPAMDLRDFALENMFLTPHLDSATEDMRNAIGLLHLQGLHAFETEQAARNRLC